MFCQESIDNLLGICPTFICKYHFSFLTRKTQNMSFPNYICLLCTETNLLRHDNLDVITEFMGNDNRKLQKSVSWNFHTLLIRIIWVLKMWKFGSIYIWIDLYHAIRFGIFIENDQIMIVLVSLILWIG